MPKRICYLEWVSTIIKWDVNKNEMEFEFRLELWVSEFSCFCGVLSVVRHSKRGRLLFWSLMSRGATPVYISYTLPSQVATCDMFIEGARLNVILFLSRSSEESFSMQPEMRVFKWSRFFVVSVLR